MKKILIALAVLLVLIFAAAIAVPYFYKDEITASVKEEINKNVNAKIDFADVDVTLFKNFPHLTLTFEDFRVSGINEFQNDTLAKIRDFNITADIMSVIKGEQIKIRSISIEEPVIVAKVLKSGKANWDIAKPDTAATPGKEEPSELNIALQKYSIENADITYIDSSLNMSLFAKGLSHSGKGDFTQDIFTLSTATTADALTFEYENIKYINSANTKMDADLKMDMKNSKYVFEKADILLNRLALAVTGFVALPNETDTEMDIQFQSKESSLKSLLSMIPAAYTEGFEDLKADGTAKLSGWVKGTSNETSLPGYGLNMDIQKGTVQYPDIPGAIKNINGKIAINNPDGIPDNTVIHIPQLHMEFDEQPFDMSLKMERPMTGPVFDTKMKGTADLKKVQRLLPVEGITRLEGTLTADLTAKGNAAELEKSNYSNFSSTGFATLQNVVYADTSLPHPVSISSARLSFNPQVAKLENFNAKLGSSDLALAGQIDNFFPYLLVENTPLKASFSMNSNYLNADEWLPQEESEEATATGEEETTVYKVPAGLDITLTTAIQKLIYDDMELKNFKGVLVIKDETATLKNVSMNALGGTILANGSYSTLGELKPKVDMKLQLQSLDIQESYKQFVTVQKLAPLAQFAQGKYSTNVEVNSELQNDMMPDWNTLNAKGLMEVARAIINNFEPLNQLGSRLKINELKQMEVKDLKPAFEIIGGKFFVKPFNVKAQDINMNISGYNAVDQTLRYVVNMEVPRKKLGAANEVLGQLEAEAKKLGLPYNPGEVVNFDAIISGKINNPKIELALKNTGDNMKDQLKKQAAEELEKQKEEMERRLKEEAEQKRKEAEEKAKEEAEKAKKQAEQRAKEEAEKARKEAERKAKEAEEKAKKEAERKAKEKLKDMFGKP